MTTLHIEHPVTDFDTWMAAFNGFADIRTASGVRGQKVHRQIDDPRYVVLDLDFDTIDDAQRFLTFLKTNVWTSPDNSPALLGTPRTSILESAI